MFFLYVVKILTFAFVEGKSLSHNVKHFKFYLC